MINSHYEVPFYLLNSGLQELHLDLYEKVNIAYDKAIEEDKKRSEETNSNKKQKKRIR